MANVYVAADPQFGRDVAIKVLPTYFLHEPLFQQRFEREARTLASLEHHAIVPVYDYGWDESPYLVMRLMKGGTLRQRLEAGPLPISEVIAILQRVGDALDTAHARGIVHRDVKSDNILFDEYGKAYLTDFGIVKLAQSTTIFTQTGRIIGTPAYMSPEQARGDTDVDGRSDIYSLGIVLYEMLTAQVPFRGETPLSLLMKHITEPVPEVNRDNPDLPPGYSAVVMRSLAKNKEDRYPTVASLVAALEAVGRSRPAAATPTLTTIEELEPEKKEGDTAIDSAPPLAKTPPPVVIPPAQQQVVRETAGESTPIRQDNPPPPPVTPAGSGAAAAGPSPVGSSTTRLPGWFNWVAAAVLGIAALIFLFILFSNGVLGGNGGEGRPTAEVESTDPAQAAALLQTQEAEDATAAAATQEASGAATATQQAIEAALAAEAMTATALSIPTETPTITPEPSPTPVGGGRRITFTSDRNGNFEIYLINNDGSELLQLTDNPATDGDPEWSPDGSKILFASERDGNFEVYVMNADGSEQARLTENDARDWAPTWSPDGSQIAFASDRNGNFDIFVMNADGSDVVQLTTSTLLETFPSWSPNGQRIAFEATVIEGVNNIFTMNPDGSNIRRVTETNARDGSPAWSPDGNRIVFQSTRDNNDGPEIYVMNADGTEQTRLTTSPRPDQYPAWSPDGSKIVFLSRRDFNAEIYVINLDGSDPVNLTNNPDSMDEFPDWGP
jgi:Tol biopolymer transport system component/serine/threonine protein kinase